MQTGMYSYTSALYAVAVVLLLYYTMKRIVKKNFSVHLAHIRCIKHRSWVLNNIDAFNAHTYGPTLEYFITAIEMTKAQQN